MPGYEIVRFDGDIQLGGGLLMLVKDGIKYIPLTNINSIECQRIEILTKCGKLNIANVYVPPLFSLPNTIIVGDWNAKNKLWNSSYENTRGRIVEQLLVDNRFVVLNTGQPTYQKHDGGMTHLDLTLVPDSLATKCT